MRASTAPHLVHADCSDVHAVVGHDAISYLKFADETACETYCEMLGIAPQIHCVGGYMNGVQVSAAPHLDSDGVKRSALFADPAIAAQVDRLDAMLRAYHADKVRRPVPAVTAQRALRDIAAAIPG